MSALVFDAFEFSRLRARTEGTLPLANLPRLADETVDKSSALQWVLEGAVDERGYSRLKLTVSATVSLVCQRCLQPMRFDIASSTQLVLAQSEAAADELDALLIDEEVEVIVGGATFNAAPIIEDEALLALPVSPRHESCPELSKALLFDSVAKESPFAVLKNLKKTSN